MNGRMSNVRSVGRGNERFSMRDRILGPAEEPPLGSHLVTPRGIYSHHGIYVGNEQVIHYGGLAHGVRSGPVEEVSLAHFAQGRKIRVRHDPPQFDRLEVVERARSRLGECNYRLLTNNCEHFCAWALQGESYSRQVEFLPMQLLAVCRAIGALISFGRAVVFLRTNSLLDRSGAVGHASSFRVVPMRRTLIGAPPHSTAR